MGVWDRIVNVFAESVPALSSKPEKEVLGADAVRGGIAIRRDAFVDLVFGSGMQRNPASTWQTFYAKRPMSVGLNLRGWGCTDTQLFDLLDEIREEPGTDGCITTLVDRFGKHPVDFVPGPEDRDKLAAEACRLYLTRVPGEFGWNQMLEDLPVGGLAHGVSIVQVMWAVRDGLLAPVAYLHEHPSQFLFQDDGALMVPENPSVANSKWRVAPRGKFVVYRQPELYHQAWGRSRLYGLRFLMQAQHLALKGWITFAEVAGVPLLLIKLPASDNQDQARDDAMEFLQNLGRSNGAVFARGEEIEAVSRTGSLTTTPNQSVVEWIERLKARVLTGGELTQSQGAKAGNFALGKIHDEGADDRVASMARRRDEAIQRCLVDPFVEWNFGKGVDVRVVTDTEDEDDAATTALVLETAIKLGVPVAIGEAREMLGLREPEPGEAVLTAPKPEPSPDPNGNGPNPSGRRESETRGEKGEEPENGDDDEEDDEEFSEFSDATNREAELLALEIQRRLDKIAAALKADNADAVASAIGDAVSRLEGAARDLGLERMDAVLSVLAGLEIPEAVAGAMEALGGARAFAFMEVMRASERIVPFPAAAVEDAPEAYKRSFEWMRARKIASKSEIEDMARAIARLDPTTTSYDVEQSLRRQVLAMKDSIGNEMASKFRDRVAKSVANGETVQQFLLDVDADVEAGKLPMGMDGYTELVYRQETANAYSEQRRHEYESGEIAPFVAGRRFSNAMLLSSRDTHKAINGLVVRKGSPADVAAGHPPWAFRCTCTFSTVIDADPASSSYREPADALERVRRIERFK